MALPLALAGGSIAFAVFLVVGLIAMAYTIYSKSGSGIDAHPISSDADPGTGRAQDESGLQDPDKGEFRETFEDGGSR